MDNLRKIPPAPNDGSTHQPSTGSRFGAKVVAIVAVIALAAVAVYLSRPPTRSETPTAAETLLPQGQSDNGPVAVLPAPHPQLPPQTALGPPFPNLDADPPPTTDLLFAELVRVTDYLQQRIPNQPDPIEIAARVQFWFGNSDQAVKLWERCVQLAPQYGHAYFGMGIAAAKRGDYEAAADFLRKSLELTPTSTESQIALGDALINAGEIEEAIAVLNRGPGPGAPSAQREALLGQACLQRHDYDAARTHYELAIRLEPCSSDAYYGLAMTYNRLGKADEAAKQMAKFKEVRATERKIRTQDKRDYDDQEVNRSEVAKKYTDIGTVLFSQGFQSEAEKIWQRAAKLAPKDIPCRQALAWLYRQSNRRQDAIRVLEELAKLEPAGIEYTVEIGRIQAELGDFDVAEQLFRQVREKAPRHPDGYLAAARLYIDSGTNLPEAVVLATEAVALEATASNYELLSETHEMNGDRAGALAAIVLAMRLDPDQPRYRQRYQRLKAEP